RPRSGLLRSLEQTGSLNPPQIGQTAQWIAALRLSDQNQSHMTCTQSSYDFGMSPARLLTLWDRLGGSAPGRWLFSKLVGLAVPSSGSIGARVESLSPGRVVLSLRDRRRVRQHLGSVHAIALANLAELSSGMAMLSSLP